MKPFWFNENERIVRIIYSDKHINPKTNKLRSNFIYFRLNLKSQKYELSCSRFEFESISFLRSFGKETEDSKFGRIYYGLGCSNIKSILSQKNCIPFYSPILLGNRINLFHTDIYDKLGTLISGEADNAINNHRKDQFLGIWCPYKDNGNSFTKEVITPYI